jgi:hypothetical protein
MTAISSVMVGCMLLAIKQGVYFADSVLGNLKQLRVQLVQGGGHFAALEEVVKFNSC